MVLVAGGRPGHPLADVWTELLRVARGTAEPALDASAGPGAGDPVTPALHATEVHGIPAAARRARSLLEAGYDQLVIVPLPPPDGAGEVPPIDELAAVIGALRLAYPGASIHDAGRSADRETVRVLGDLVAIPQQAADELLAGAIARGFAGEPARLAGLVALLSRALPADTTIALRGSTVMGRAFRDGAPYDAGGPGSSDLDLVVMGDAVADLWVPEARLLGGINTLPLNDEAPWVAPALEAPRREAQAVVDRPLSIQSMARWFLDLRVALQGQPYVVLAGPP